MIKEKIKKLNLGSGNDYRNSKHGWVNLDFNKDVKTDIYHDLNKKLPFKENEFDYILVDNTLEHVEKMLELIDELWRIARAGAIIDIYVPHFSGIYAFKHISHKNYFGIGSFDTYKEISGLDKGFTGERYGKARFKILKQELLYFHHKSAEIQILSKLPINFLFNFSRKWQLILEKFFPLKFDEVHFKLQVLKKEKYSEKYN